MCYLLAKTEGNGNDSYYFFRGEMEHIKESLLDSCCYVIEDATDLFYIEDILPAVSSIEAENDCDLVDFINLAENEEPKAADLNGFKFKLNELSIESFIFSRDEQEFVSECLKQFPDVLEEFKDETGKLATEKIKASDIGQAIAGDTSWANW